jgi:hypothetical protein
VDSEFALAGSRAGTDKRASLKLRRAWNATGDLVSGLNNGVENAVRLASYRAARESGLSKRESASIAKNVTVNFNRRGQYGVMMNAGYLFYNAAIQGNVRLMQALYHSSKARKIAAGIVVAGVMNEMLNAMLTGMDDDDESFYDKIPAFEKARNIIIMHPNGETYTKIPLAYGINAFWETGRTTAEIMRRGGDRWQESAAQLAATTVDAFNPIGFDYAERSAGEAVASLIMPTIGDSILEHGINKDYMGNPIYRDAKQYGTETTDAQNYFPRVGEHWKAITEFLTESTGGNVVEAGMIDVSPETLEFMWGTLTGAAGTFAERIFALPGKVTSGEAEANDFPFARKVVGAPSPGRDRNVFYDRMRETEAQVTRGMEYYELGMTDNLQTFIQEHERVLAMEPATDEARRLTRSLSRDKRASTEALERGLIDDAAHEANMDIINEQEAQIVLAYNRLWNQTLYPERTQ